MPSALCVKIDRSVSRVHTMQNTVLFLRRSIPGHNIMTTGTCRQKNISCERMNMNFLPF